jgi:hypothetical protein
MTKITYQALDETLRSLGFTYRGVIDKNKVYLHEKTGGHVVFVELPPEQEVLPRHLLAVRSVLDAYGIADSLELDAQLLKAT